MLIAAAFTASMMGLLAFALLVCVVAATLLRKRSPVASASPSDGGGSRVALDYFLPCPSTLELASPLAGLTPPSGHSSPDVVWAMGRGMNDFKCAKSVEITIDRDKVWLEVDGVNVFRAYNVQTIEVEDRRNQTQEKINAMR